MPRFSPTRLLPLVLLALLAVPRFAGAEDAAQADLSGKYALLGEADDGNYHGTVALKKKDTYKLPAGPLADVYEMEWQYKSGKKDLGLGVRMGDVLYVAWSESPRVQLCIAQPSPFSESQRTAMAADYREKFDKAYKNGSGHTMIVDKSLFPRMRPEDNYVVYSFQRGGLCRLASMSGPANSLAGEFEYAGITIKPNGERDGQYDFRSKITIEAHGPGFDVTGAGRDYMPEVNDFAIEGAALPLKDGLFLFSTTGQNWNPNGVGVYTIEGTTLKGELYDRQADYRPKETLTR